MLHFCNKHEKNGIFTVFFHFFLAILPFLVYCIVMNNKKHKNNFLVIYKSAWGRISTKEIAAFNLRSVVSRFEKIKPNATIQKVYLTNGMECGWSSYEMKGGY